LIKNLLYGTNDTEPQTDIVVSQLAQELYNSNLLLLLIQNLNRIDFEGKKDVAQVFNNVLRRQIGTRSPTVEYICTKPEILFTLMAGYEHQEIALNCGTMLRECARYEALAKIMLHSEEFFNFFQYVEVSTFDIASDAFSTFKVNSKTFDSWKQSNFFHFRSFSPATNFSAQSSWKPTTTKSSRTISDC
jgi:calcium binding protein 39